MARRRKTKGSLQRYYAKRHFGKTPEPRGRIAPREGRAARGGRAFVIQKHGARRLHYDFRLEWDGTLKSWAVPKGPSLDPGDKRLAVRVEDHPLDYGGFEGVIPEGEYGAGPVIIWDRGTWQPDGDPNKADAKGRLNFTMDGEKMRGAWALVRIGGGRYGARDKSAKQNWLLIKRTDEAAQRGKGDILVTKKPNSVKSGRSLEDVRAGKGRVRTWHSNRAKGNGSVKPKPARRRAAAEDADMPDFIPPELATRVDRPPAGGEKIVRHASFKGLREDKPAADVTRETPKQAMASKLKATKGREKLFAVLSHPDRVLYDAQGITKLGLAEYYADVAELMIPHVRERPLSLVRCPGGTTGGCFYQKSVPQGTPEAVYEVHNTARGKKETYPAIRNVEGLIGLTQMGTLELHIWGCKAAKIMTPDRIVFDVDPDVGMAWERVIAAAIEIRDRLKDIGLESFLKTTGGKGLHVAAPITAKHEWDTIKAFTKAFAARMMRDSPERYVVTVSKKARKGKLFIDYLRNGYGATFVAPYSPRARPNAPISMPLEWKELTPAMHSDHFRLENVAARLKSLKHDPWRDMLKLRQGITAKMLKQFGVAS